MKIQFRQTGGIAGLTRFCDVDTSKLKPDEVKVWETAVRDSRFFDLEIEKQELFPDAFLYVIQIEDGVRSKSLSYHDGNIPRQAELLMTLLNQYAQYEKQ